MKRLKKGIKIFFLLLACLTAAGIVANLVRPKISRLESVNPGTTAFMFEGGTITQQLVKNLYLRPDKNPIRKLREAILTWRMERVLEKRTKEILDIMARRGLKDSAG